MSERFLLDTNVVSELTRPRVEPKVQNWIAAQKVGSFLISVVSVGENEKGFADGLLQGNAIHGSHQLFRPPKLT